MKKLILLLVVSLLFACSLFAISPADSYEAKLAYVKGQMQHSLVPMFTSGINLRSNKFPSLVNEIKNKKSIQYSEDPNADSVNGVLYHRYNIVLTGGCTFTVPKGKEKNHLGYETGEDDNLDVVFSNEEQVLYEVLNGGTIKCSVSSESGELVLNSQSNIAYRRPIELYGILKSCREPVIDKEASYNSSIISLDAMYIDNENRYREYKNITFKDHGEDYPKLNGGASIYFDILVGLPGKFTNDTNTILEYGLKEYRLAQADDYTAVISVAISLEDKYGNEISRNAMTFPLAGYVTNDPTTGAVDIATDPELAEAAMSIQMLPGAFNIDLINDAEKSIDIATINLIATYGAEATDESFFSDPKNVPNYINIFLSSSVSPYVQGNEFSFKKKYSNYDTAINYSAANSLPFTLTMISNTNIPTGEYIFDGTTYSKQNDQIVGTNVRLDKPEPVWKYHVGQWKYGRYTIPFAYEGTISVKTEKAPEYLEAGLYQETVYVHVLSER